MNTNVITQLNQYDGEEFKGIFPLNSENQFLFANWDILFGGIEDIKINETKAAFIYWKLNSGDNIRHTLIDNCNAITPNIRYRVIIDFINKGSFGILKLAGTNAHCKQTAIPVVSSMVSGAAGIRYINPKGFMEQVPSSVRFVEVNFVLVKNNVEKFVLFSTLIESK